MRALRAVLLSGLFVLGTFAMAGSASLIDGGEIHQASTPMVLWHSSGGDEVLTLDGEGVFMALRWDGEAYLVTRAVDLNVTVNAVRVDQAASLLAIGHASGALVLDLDTDQVTLDLDLPDPVDDVDWDDDGDVWVVHNGGLRQAIEHETGGPSGVRTSVMSAGICSLLILEDGRVLTGGFDARLRVHDDAGIQDQDLTGLGGAPTQLIEDGDHVWAGLSNGRVVRWNTTTWSSEEAVSGTAPVTSLALDGKGGVWVGHQNGRSVQLDSTLTVTQEHQATGKVITVVNKDDGTVHLVSITSTSTRVRLLDIDADGDGVADAVDAFPNDAGQTADSDGDGYGDNTDLAGGDAFPNDPTQWSDRDGDGYGDEASGTNGDAFPDDPDQWEDADGDGVGDNQNDPDGDAFPEDSTQWSDRDRDGFGDAPNGVRPDDCPDANGFSSNDRRGCPDQDLDGWSDPDADWLVAQGADAFPTDQTQWEDFDGDGYGDNPDGTTPDACLTAGGTSLRALVPELGATTRYVSEAHYGCPDLDGDGWADASEVGEGMDANPDEHMDLDGDGVGANADYNDTNPLVIDIEDHCLLSFDDLREVCIGWRSTEYQEYLSTLNETERGRMSYNYWNQSIAGSSSSGGLDMALVTEVGLVAAGVFVVCSVVVLLFGAVTKRARRPSEQKSFGSFEFDASANEEALTGKAGLSASGGLDDDLWNDDDTTAYEEADETVVEDVPDVTSMVEDVVLQTDDVTSADEEASPEVADAAPAQPEGEPEREAPPVPDGGLPDGWTMDQWTWYGHQWLEQNQGD